MAPRPSEAQLARAQLQVSVPFLHATGEAHLLGNHVEADDLHSGDLGDFASFVTHMKQIAIVSSLLSIVREPLC